MIFKPGQMIRFTYSHQSVDDQTGEKFKEVLVLHPHWRNLVHGIDLKRLSPAERKVLELILDPEQRNVPSRIPLVNNIRRRMDPIEEIQNPVVFYTKFVKPFLNGKDAYRTYVPRRMAAVTVLKDFSIATGQRKNPKPLFGPRPGEQKPQQDVPMRHHDVPQDTTGMSPIDIMARDAKNRGLK